jgi:hypothetical protein
MQTVYFIHSFFSAMKPDCGSSAKQIGFLDAPFNCLISHVFHQLAEGCVGQFSLWETEIGEDGSTDLKTRAHSFKLVPDQGFVVAPFHYAVVCTMGKVFHKI